MSLVGEAWAHSSTMDAWIYMGVLPLSHFCQMMAWQITDVTDVVSATEGENASAAQPDVNAQITAAVAAENSRIMGILNCEEAHGREEQARVLAETPGMTVETARRILAAAPQSAQARSDTALDRLMQGAPAPLAAGNPASDAVNDLLNTPV